MPARLKDRNKSIPYGFKYLEPATQWKPAPFSSFETVCRGLLEVRRANPFLAQKNKWSLDLDEIRNEIDAYNAKLCEAMGWKDYIVTDIPEGGPPKPWPRSHLAHVGRAVGVGASTILEMFGQEGPIRDKTLATKRAQVCLSCPLNDTQGSWERFFTAPAANLIRKALGALKGLQLQTEHDSKLGVCSACYCEMRLKIWSRLENILAHIPPEDKAKLHASCWITHPLE